MKIEITDATEFHKLLDNLLNELVSAQIHFDLYDKLLLAINEYREEFYQSPMFWNFTLKSHMDSVMSHLCRAYDQYERGRVPPLNLRNLLDTIEANLAFFEKDDFKQRLKGNPYVDSLLESARMPNQVQLSLDIKSVMSEDLLVNKLIRWRNTSHAHLNSAYVLGPTSEQFEVGLDDIKALLANGLEIGNRYSDLFSATRYLTKPSGHDDYKRILEAVRESMASHQAKIQEDISRIQQSEG